MNNPKSSEYKVSKTRKYKTNLSKKGSTRQKIVYMQFSEAKKKQLLTGQEKFNYIKLKGMQRSMTATTKRKTLS